MVQMPNSTDLLIAPPGIPDYRFRNAVLMLTHDVNGGAFALCVNRPTEHTLQDIVDELGIETNLNFPLYWGGPVSPGTVWMLHSAEWSTEHTITIDSEWAMTSNLDMFVHLADGDFPREFRIMFGYCTWGRGQLLKELEGEPPYKPSNAWLVATNPGSDWLFEYPVDELWAAATELSAREAVANWLS